LVDLAERIILPFAPVDLQPPNDASGVSDDPHLFFRDPGAGTPAAAFLFDYLLLQNGVVLNSPPLTVGPEIASPLSPPGVTWFFPLPPGRVTLTVSGKNKAGRGPTSTSTFTVGPPPVQGPKLKKPHITVTYTPPPASAKFTIKGSDFTPNHVVHIRGVNSSDLQHPAFADTTSDSSGAINFQAAIPCNQGTQLSFSANDERPDSSDLTGTLFSNTVAVTAS
jgi:hypothetical protein